ncbi:hypothetical protein PV379_04325 [Streptomyces caniscabiei]|uniref:hypothetical protein n=1 Tax=Streptomyces caniscabiei TaxID=2746961 RepID=UPI0029A1562D|nr:hypothetical protein [Streptomyces caniscabiei]MDX2776563.1 hypothetical protein [Streptomyces caniscabiei]
MNGMTATKLRLILSCSLVLIAAMLIGAFVFFYGQLRDAATSTNHTVVDAAASQNNIATLDKIEDFLKENSQVVERARSIVADSQSYQYQDQIITDLNDFAGRNGVTITNVDFTGTTPPATTTSPSATAPAPSQPTTSGIKSTSATITIKTPVNYDNLLRFLESIERNLTKMQISKVSLSRGSAEGNDIVSDALTIEVYIR